MHQKAELYSEYVMAFKFFAKQDFFLARCCITYIINQVAQSHIDYMLSKIPMGRFGLVEEIAATVAWACTEDCSFTTGATFDLSGGRATY